MWGCRGDSYSLMWTNSCLTSLCSAVLATLGGIQEALPLSKCPKKCSMRGQCSRVESDTPSCACFRGYSVSFLRVRMLFLAWLLSLLLGHYVHRRTAVSMITCPEP